MADARLTPGRLGQFLRWLSPDPDCAGARYNEIHAALRRTFAYRGCTEPQYWADVTVDRVIGKIERVAPGYHGDPALYLNAVARKVFLEYVRTQARAPHEPLSFLEPRAAEPSRGDETDATTERRLACLDRCLAELSPEERETILLYYQGERGDKIAQRRRLAGEASLSRAALRKRSQRIRARIKQQLLALLSEEPPADR